jgi:hypothetical protein
MSNKITYTVKTENTTKAVEYWNPVTNQYQDANPIINIPAGTYTGLKARLKGSNPYIIANYSASVVVVDAVVTNPTNPTNPTNNADSPVWLMAMGDSQATQFLGKPWPIQIEEKLDLTQYSFMDNNSVGGYRIQHILDVIPAYIAAWKKAEYPQAIAVFYLGVNNTIDTMPLVDAVSQYRQCTSLLNDAGVKCIYVTFNPNRGQYQSNPALDAQQLALRNAYNQEMIANGVSQHGFAAVVDVTADTRIGLDDSPITQAGTYFSADDRLHLLTDGQRVLAEYIAPVIQQLAGSLPPPVVAADVVGFTTLVGMKEVYKTAVRDTANPAGGGERVSLSKAFGLPITDRNLNSVKFRLNKGHMRGLHGVSIRPDGNFTDTSYYGLFAGFGVYFSDYNDTFQCWENGNYRPNSIVGFSDGQMMELQYDGFCVYVLVDNQLIYTIALADKNVGSAFFANWRCGAKVGPIHFKAESPINQPN